MKISQGANYQLGAIYALTTAVLLAIQEPFSALAARSLTSPEFVCLTQIALLLSVPLLIVDNSSRRDFVAILFNRRNAVKFAILFIVGICGLLLYNVGLSSAHPIITAGVLNLSPFWAALVALVISRRVMPGSPLLFGACFLVAFVGAMAIAWSQINVPSNELYKDVLASALHSKWVYALPMPIFFALSGSLVGKWFPEFEESAAIAANFVVSAVLLIPTTLFMAYHDSQLHVGEQSPVAILMLLVGTLASSAAGRVFYQVALTTTENDNGFVTMFFLAIPVVSSLISIPLSRWIPDLRVAEGPSFFWGLLLVTAPLLIFSVKIWRDDQRKRLTPR